MDFTLYLIYTMFLDIFKLFFTLAIKLRLGILALYIGVLSFVPSLRDWSIEHEALSIAIFIGLAIFVLISWFFTFRRYLRQLTIERKTHELLTRDHHDI